MKVYVGIDPGQRGFMCVMSDRGIDFLSFEDESLYRVAETLKSVSETGSCVVAIEDVHAMPKQGVATTFKFGFNVGMLHGLFVAYGIKFVTVTPQEWQKEIWVRQDKVKVSGKADPKKTSINAARRLFPDIDLRRNEHCRAPHDGKADSLLICEYARRRNL